MLHQVLCLFLWFRVRFLFRTFLLSLSSKESWSLLPLRILSPFIRTSHSPPLKATLFCGVWISRISHYSLLSLGTSSLLYYLPLICLLPCTFGAIHLKTRELRSPHSDFRLRHSSGILEALMIFRDSLTCLSIGVM